MSPNANAPKKTTTPATPKAATPKKPATPKAPRQAKAHLTLDNVNTLMAGNTVTINIGADLILTLTSDTIKQEVDNLVNNVSTKTDSIFADVKTSFRKIFGKK